MRKHYLDNIRWSSVVLVVIYHVLYMFNAENIPGVAGAFHPTQYQDTIAYLLYPWFMVLLFIVSGMSAKYYLDTHSGKEFLRSRTVKLLVPSSIGLLVFQWIQGYFNMSLSGVFDSISEMPVFFLYPIMVLSGIGVLWYIQLLWVFSLVLLLLRKIEKGRLSALCGKIPCSPILLALLGVLVWGAAQILNTPIITVYRFGIYGFTFLLGYYLFTREDVTDQLMKYFPLWATGAVVLGISYVVIYFGENYAVSPCVNCPLAVAYLWCMCLAVLGGMKRFYNRSSPFAGFMTKKSWGLYIFHYLPISICGLYLKRTALPPVLIYLITAIAAFAGAFLLYETISRIPVIRWCVLGISKKKKEKSHVSG